MAEQYYISKKYHEISILAKETAKQMSKKAGRVDKVSDYCHKAVLIPI